MTTNYYIHDGLGNLIQTGSCPHDHVALQAREGFFVEIGDPPAHIKYPARLETHDSLRRDAYPPIGDQLDALFRAGAFPPDMAAQIAAVKAQYPKT